MQSLHNVRAHNLFSYLERGGQKYKYCHYCHCHCPGIADLNVDGRPTRTEKEKADVLNEFFTSVFTTEDTTDIPTIPPQALSTELRYYNFNEEDVRKMLEALKVSKAAGHHPHVTEPAISQITE